MDDLYRILGINRSASLEEIKSAYHELALKYHPDFNPGNHQAEECFKRVSCAYAVLSDAGQRARYDAEVFRSKVMGAESSEWKNPYENYSAADFVGAFNYFFNCHQTSDCVPAVVGAGKESSSGYESVIWGVVIFVIAMIIARFTGRLGILGYIISLAILFFGLRFIIRGFIEIINNRTGQ